MILSRLSENPLGTFLERDRLTVAHLDEMSVNDEGMRWLGLESERFIGSFLIVELIIPEIFGL